MQVVEGLFARLDANSDERVSLDELRAWLAGCCEGLGMTAPVDKQVRCMRRTSLFVCCALHAMPA